jgi:hypothetical protein
MKTFFACYKSLLIFPIVAFLLLVTGFGLFNLQHIHAQDSSSLSQQISQDPFTNSTSQHQTQVEPGTFSFGPTVVSAFQSGRFYAGGGASGISWATSFDAGHTWKTGILPDLTTYNGGPYARVGDSVVAYDVAHHVWLIASVPATTQFEGTVGTTSVVVSRSSDGLHWSNPVVVAAPSTTQQFDKDWIVCDEHPTSRFFGRCYAQWDDAASTPWKIMMSYSNDGGLTWSAPQSPANQTFYAQGGQPLVQPDGTVIVPIYGFDSTGAEGIYSYRSTDGGASWTDLTKIAPLIYSTTADQFYRGGSLPSAQIDQAGKVYVVWAGCYFEANCGNSSSGPTTDDIVLTTTTDGLTWTPLQRIPLDPIGSDVEHLTAGIAVDSSTAGNQAHLAVTYYYWPNAGCTASTCQIYAGLATSTDGGTSWSPHLTLGGPMAATWWANTDQGYMTGDYITTTITLNQAVTVVPLATAPTGQTLHQAMYAASVSIAGGSLPCDTLNAAAAPAQAAQKGSATKMHYHAD